mgnify:CR=1 FL=1|uniref:Histidine kinase n=1 Tax=Geoglobus ahangari TaxID=113653 RepID=A0A7C4W434_9EURY
MIDVDLINPDEIKDLKDCETLMILSPEKVGVELKENLNYLSIPYFGGVFPGVIYRKNRYDDKIVVVRFQEKLKIFRDSEMPEHVTGSLIVFVDGLYPQAEDILERAYFNYGLISYIGGGAGSLTLKEIDCLFDNRGFFKKGCLFANVKKRIKLAVRHGWSETGTTFIATKTNGRVIMELDWKPAFEVYKEHLEKMGKIISEENFFEVAKAYPFGVSKMEGEFIIRDPLSTENGMILCAGKVRQNSVLSLMKGDKNKLIEAARKCSESIESDRVFVADCISRVLYLGYDFKKELKAIDRECFGPLTIGEVASSETFIEFHNKTIVVGDI